MIAIFLWAAVPILGVPLVTLDRDVETIEVLLMFSACASGVASVVTGFIYERAVVRREFGANLGTDMERMIAEGKVQRTLRPIQRSFRKMLAPVAQMLRGKGRA